MADYLPYDIIIENSEKWMERPIKVTLNTPTPNGTTGTAIYLDQKEAFDLIHKLAHFAVKLGEE